MNFELKREEEALASRETPPESHLLDAVRDLIEGEDDGDQSSNVLGMR